MSHYKVYAERKGERVLLDEYKGKKSEVLKQARRKARRAKLLAVRVFYQ